MSTGFLAAAAVSVAAVAVAAAARAAAVALFRRPLLSTGFELFILRTTEGGSPGRSVASKSMSNFRKPTLS
eukprot:CAMPEP_0171963602 /NCGR_PEP_ID=MMETSP0993-20121228/176594_1 /TAXON_ID=483369 /ORGANISM="non described non described, Strain CCMP2098" /LENGTH=70 /DNA_ID=CAMNT_0012612255 /DNA_START=231 /DNA_END=443 /DNA_ORIENTATION=-